MGRQIGFYMTLRDEETLLSQLRTELQCKVLLPRLSAGGKLQEVGRLQRIRQGHNLQGQLLLVPESLLSKLTIDKFGANNHRVNEHHSPVIVWTRGLASATGSYPGRFWFEVARPGKRKKSAVFSSWAARVFRRVQMMCAVHPRYSKSRRLGADFLSLLEAGKLCMDVSP
jgi:hypothetical protein